MVIWNNMRTFAKQTSFETMIHHYEIPTWWAVCMKADCPMAENCLRLQAYKSLPSNVTKWPCVLPNALSDGHCIYYQKAERVKMSRGFGNLYSLITNRQARKAVRLELTDYLGSKGTYHRYQHGERLLRPEQQEYIQQLAKTYGNGEAVVFSDNVETFDFRNIP